MSRGIILSLLMGATMAYGIDSIDLLNPTEFNINQQTEREICNTIALSFLKSCPVEVRADAGLNEFATAGTIMDQGYTQQWTQAYQHLLSEIQSKRAALDGASPLVRREVDLTIGILQDYVDMLRLNKEHRRISLFMPPNLMDPQDAIDSIMYVFGNINSLIIKGFSPDIAAQRFKNYVRPDSNNPGFIDGAIAELKNLIGQYEKDGKPLFYPSIRQLDNITDPKKLEAIVSELPTLIGTNSSELIAEFQAQINRYVDFINTVLRPHAPAESQLPRDLYLTYLRLYGVNDTPEQLIERAQQDWSVYYGRYQDLAQEIARERGLSETDPAKLIARLENESSLDNEAAVMDLYHQAQAQVEAWIKQNNLMTLPGRSIRMRAGTNAEEASFPVPHVNTPNFINNTGTVWPVFVLCDLKGNSSRMTADPLIVHEGRPGHDLQFSRMLELYLDNKLNLLETVIASNSANAEGWAHYVEYLMAPYMPKESQLSALRDQLLRIGRMFLDPQLNSQQIGYDDVVEFMREKVGFESMATSEAKRYSFMIPGQATSYRYGAIKIMDLRDRLQEQLGEAFSFRKFHDAILSFGLLPVDLYADLIIERMGDI